MSSAGTAPRPRPVTATVGKLPPSGTYRPRKNVSLLSSSSGSTESLLSGIDDASVRSDSETEVTKTDDQPITRKENKSGNDEKKDNSQSDYSYRWVSYVVRQLTLAVTARHQFDVCFRSSAETCLLNIYVRLVYHMPS